MKKIIIIALLIPAICNSQIMERYVDSAIKAQPKVQPIQIGNLYYTDVLKAIDSFAKTLDQYKVRPFVTSGVSMNVDTLTIPAGVYTIDLRLRGTNFTQSDKSLIISNVGGIYTYSQTNINSLWTVAVIPGGIVVKITPPAGKINWILKKENLIKIQ